MKNLWNDTEALQYKQSDLDLRVYTSRLLGQNEDLVMHGGGNTSVKIAEKNIFGEGQEVLYVKGSGWDLKTIEKAGFTPVLMDHLTKLGKLPTMTDTEMVRELKVGMLNPSAPSPSVETILHALIPFKFVDHTHADAVVTISNTPDGEKRIRDLYGDEVLVLPYIMPGFILAKQVHAAIKNIDLNKFKGIVLLHHGIFTFSDSAKLAYDNMIELVSKAEDYLKERKAWDSIDHGKEDTIEALQTARLRRVASEKHGSPMIVRWHGDKESNGFASRKDVAEIATRGPITPDHVIQTKRVAAIFDGKIDSTLTKFEDDYKNYFKDHSNAEHTILDTAPRVVVVPGKGIYTLAPNAKRSIVVDDIYRHTMRAIQWAEHLGGWQALSAKDIFDLEYWELEQAKLKKSGAKPEFEGKIALVTGAASGIGKACVEDLLKKGACVIATDIGPEVSTLAEGPHFLGLICDVTHSNSIETALQMAVNHFGGLDILISNAGTFPPSAKIDELDEEVWQKTIDINLSGHFRVLKSATPYLKEGIDPCVIFVGTKNVAAPGPGAAAYSSAKAAQTQLARVAALELGPYGIRVNSVHPNSVFDTGIWTEEVLQNRAKAYGLSVEEYKCRNILKVEIKSADVARLVSELATKTFAKTTGAQISIDGGNERVI